MRVRAEPSGTADLARAIEQRVEARASEPRHPSLPADRPVRRGTVPRIPRRRRGTLRGPR